jgi:hypothetical protein
LFSLMTFFSLQPFVYIGVRTHLLFLNSYFFKEVRIGYVPPFSNSTIFALQPPVYMGVRTLLHFFNSYFLIGYVPGTYLLFQIRRFSLCSPLFTWRYVPGTYRVPSSLIISPYSPMFSLFYLFLTVFTPYNKHLHKCYTNISLTCGEGI